MKSQLKSQETGAMVMIQMLDHISGMWEVFSSIPGTFKCDNSGQ